MKTKGILPMRLNGDQAISLARYGFRLIDGKLVPRAFQGKGPGNEVELMA